MQRTVPAWMAVIGAIVIAFVVTGLTISVLHFNIHSNIDGLAALATIIGGVGVFGGLVAGLFGLYSLTTVDDKIKVATDKLSEDAKKVLEKTQAAYAKELADYKTTIETRLADHLLDLSTYQNAKDESNILDAEQALQTIAPRFPLASQYLGESFWRATWQWA